MKLDITQLKEVPGHIKQDNFSLCVFGNPTEEISQWIHTHKLQSEFTGKYTNIIIPEEIPLNEIFLLPSQFYYMDGFSPNLNKHLHIGHFSNLVFAKAFQKLKIAKKTITVLGDTLIGDVTKDDAYLMFLTYTYNYFGYFMDKFFFASKLKADEKIMIDGEGEFEGTKVFDVGDEKIVGIKSNGTTSYFYQDVAVAQELNKPTVYITGSEQKEHFANLKKLFPKTHHIPLGLVQIKEKMSSRNGNVIFMSDLIATIKEQLSTDNIQLVYNIFAGFILKTSPESSKKIDLKLISNAKNSPGLYISYTMARISNAGLPFEHSETFNDKKMEYALLKAKFTLMPHILFEALLDKCKELNQLYVDYTIKDNPENHKIYLPIWNDFLLASKYLGLIFIPKV